MNSLIRRKLRVSIISLIFNIGLLSLILFLAIKRKSIKDDLQNIEINDQRNGTNTEQTKNLSLEQKFFVNSQRNDAKTDQTKTLSLEQKMFPDLKNCVTNSLETKYVQHGHYWVLPNYITASETFHCNETITYTTLGEIGYLHNLVEIAERWQGPVSVAVLAHGSTFDTTLDTIFHLRECVSKDVKKFVTFHIFFNFWHIPEEVPNSEKLMEFPILCSRNLKDLDVINNYRRQHHLLFPINIARNIAIKYAATYFIFPSDIELIPSVNIIPEFFKLLGKPDVSHTTNKRVYVLPIFDVAENQTLPKFKEELILLLKKQKAFLFHEKICRLCHEIPSYHKWLKADIKSGLSVITIGKRKNDYIYWEPFYISTKKIPLFDERLMAEGNGNKLDQNFAMCLMDYEYHILDNAFIVHEPEKKRKDSHFKKLRERQQNLSLRVIRRESEIFYGTNKECLNMSGFMMFFYNLLRSFQA